MYPWSPPISMGLKLTQVLTSVSSFKLTPVTTTRPTYGSGYKNTNQLTYSIASYFSSYEASRTTSYNCVYTVFHYSSSDHYTPYQHVTTIHTFTDTPINGGTDTRSTNVTVNTTITSQVLTGGDPVLVSRVTSVPVSRTTSWSTGGYVTYTSYFYTQIQTPFVGTYNTSVNTTRSTPISTSRNTWKYTTWN